MNLADWTAALKARDIFKTIAQQVLRDERPAPRLATVQSINRTGRTCVVIYNGESEPVTVPMGSIEPFAAGQIVRIDGVPGDRHVVEVLGRAVMAGGAAGLLGYKTVIGGGGMTIPGPGSSVQAVLTSGGSNLSQSVTVEAGRVIEVGWKTWCSSSPADTNELYFNIRVDGDIVDQYRFGHWAVNSGTPQGVNIYEGITAGTHTIDVTCHDLLGHSETLHCGSSDENAWKLWIKDLGPTL